MKYLLIAIGVIAILYYYFFVHRKKVLLKNMSSAINMVKMGLYGRLKSKYETKYDDEKAGLLAAVEIPEVSDSDSGEVSDTIPINFRTLVLVF